MLSTIRAGPSGIACVDELRQIAVVRRPARIEGKEIQLHSFRLPPPNYRLIVQHFGIVQGGTSSPLVIRAKTCEYRDSSFLAAWAGRLQVLVKLL